MYLFPKIDIPQKAVDEAKKRGKEADVMYALDLLGTCGRAAGLSISFDGPRLTDRRDGYLRSGGFGLRAGARDVPSSSDGAVSRCGGLRGQD